MLLDPALGYYDEGLDLTEAALYRRARDPFGQAETLPPASYRSKVFSALEDNRIWTRSWIAVGLEQQIPDAGDLLPFTIGYHGIHLQREAGGGIIGRFNKAQHGGCRSVPLQCQTGTRTRCSFTSCGFSRDRDVIPAGELESDGSAAQQYLGMVPERLLPARVERRGSLLFTCLDPRTPAPPDLDAALPGWSDERLALAGRRWFAAAANWKLIGPALRDRLAERHGAPAAGAASDVGVLAHWGQCDSRLSLFWGFPNLLLLRGSEETLVLLLQPLSMGETQVRALLLSRDATGQTALPEHWTSLLEACFADAGRQQRLLSLWGTPQDPQHQDEAAPQQSSAFAWQFQDYLISRILQED